MYRLIVLVAACLFAAVTTVGEARLPDVHATSAKVRRGSSCKKPFEVNINGGVVGSNSSKVRGKIEHLNVDESKPSILDRFTGWTTTNKVVLCLPIRYRVMKSTDHGPKVLRSGLLDKHATLHRATGEVTWDPSVEFVQVIFDGRYAR